MKLVRLFKQALKLPELLGVTEQAEEQRNALALAAVKVMSVTTQVELTVASAVAQDIQSYIREVEEYGVAFRAPLREFLATVKKTEDDHIAVLLEEKARVEKLGLGFVLRERQRAADEERKRNEEFRRREQERVREEQRLVQERAAREAEAKRVQDAKDVKLRKEREAAEALTAAARNKKQREEAEAARQEAMRKERVAEERRRVDEAAARERAERESAKIEADKQANYDLLRQPVPQVAKANGATVKNTMEFEVVSAALVYQHRPELCKVEVKREAVKSTVVARQGSNVADKDEATVPGLRLWWEDNLYTRRREAGQKQLI